MKIKETSPGKVYALDSMNGCEVMNGNVVVQVPAMTQTIVIANSDCLTSEDDTVTITEVFKLAPALYRQGEDGGNWMKEAYDGLVSIVGVGNFKWEFLDNPYRVVVHTDRADDTQLEAVAALLARTLPKNINIERYNHHIEVSWRDINRFADCVTSSDILAAAPNGSLGELVTSDGWWVYTFPKCDDVHKIAHSGNAPTIASKLKHLIVDGQLFGRFGGYWVSQAFPFHYCGRLESVKLTNYKPTFMQGWFENCPKLSHVDIDYSETNKANTRLGSIFYNCILDKWSVLRIDETLPVKHASAQAGFTIGIHVDHQNDDEVLAAIANFEAKGWELTVQWNGTPTAQATTTYGLRKPPIYAKVNEHERPDGTTVRVLDWGHYVTDPTGYEEFSSVEAAREYFGLPEEEETIIEEQ